MPKLTKKETLQRIKETRGEVLDSVEYCIEYAQENSVFIGKCRNWRRRLVIRWNMSILRRMKAHEIFEKYIELINLENKISEHIHIGKQLKTF